MNIHETPCLRCAHHACFVLFPSPPSEATAANFRLRAAAAAAAAAQVAQRSPTAQRRRGMEDIVGQWISQFISIQFYWGFFDMVRIG